MSSNIFNPLKIKEAYVFLEKENSQLFRWVFNFDVQIDKIILFRNYFKSIEMGSVE